MVHWELGLPNQKTYRGKKVISSSGIRPPESLGDRWIQAVKGHVSSIGKWQKQLRKLYPISICGLCHPRRWWGFSCTCPDPYLCLPQMVWLHLRSWLQFTSKPKPTAEPLASSWTLHCRWPMQAAKQEGKVDLWLEWGQWCDFLRKSFHTNADIQKMAKGEWHSGQPLHQASWICFSVHKTQENTAFLAPKTQSLLWETCRWLWFSRKRSRKVNQINPFIGLSIVWAKYLWLILRFERISHCVGAIYIHGQMADQILYFPLT